MLGVNRWSIFFLCNLEIKVIQVSLQKEPHVFSVVLEVCYSIDPGHTFFQSACLSILGFTPYQQYFTYLMATVQKSMFPGLFLNQYLTTFGIPRVRDHLSIGCNWWSNMH